MKEFWQRERWFTWFTVSMMLMFGGIYSLTHGIQLSGWTKLLLGFVVLLFLILLMGGVAIAESKRTKETKEKKEVKETKEGAQLLGGIIKDVPANQRWVLRNALGSDIDDLDIHGRPRGYQARKPGWDFCIPYYHIDLGFVDLSPQPRDPEAITVNVKNNQTAIIDWRIETFIPDSNSAIKFAVKVNSNRKEFEDKKATVIFNHLSSQKTQDDITNFDTDELKKFAEDAADQFNEDMADLGIQARALEIKKILMPEEIRAAAEYETVTKKREKVAIIKGKELKTIITATKADPTKVVMTDMARDMLTNLADVVVNAFRTHQETKEKKEVSK